MKQYYSILFLCIAAYGAYYFAAHKKILERKFYGEEVPEGAERTAKVIGVVLIAVGLIGALLFWLEAD